MQHAKDRRNTSGDDGTTSDRSRRPSLGVNNYSRDNRVTDASTRAPPRYDNAPRAQTQASPSHIEAVPGAQPPSVYQGLLNGAPVVVRPADDDPVFFHSEDYPFTIEQFDRKKEETLGVNVDQLPGNVPVMTPENYKQIQLSKGDPATSSLQEWDNLCVSKHIGAIASSMATQDEIDSFVLMIDEQPLQFMRLAGVAEAPGLHENVAQHCSMTFTSKNRLIFTQAKHSAELGVPSMGCCHAFIPCFHDQWSSRSWSSFYASIHASEVLQVFVQQTLTTKYHKTKCACHDICAELCLVGGYMRTDKDIEGMMQTLGDHDPDGLMKKFDKTRTMRHALVVRYVDCATNSVRQTVALAHPNIPANDLYQMARSIEEKITLRSADWFKNKTLPTPLPVNAFQKDGASIPLLKRRSYKVLLAVLLSIALLTLPFNATAGVFMIIAVLIAFGGSYVNLGKAVAKAGGFGPTSSGISLPLTQGFAGFVYLVSFFGSTF